jgi:serine/threonine protein phosphatase PrpC
VCSSDLHDLVSDREIKNIVTSIRNPQRAAELLIKLANERGGRDNITVILIKISGSVKLLQAAVIVLFLTLIICGGWFYFNRDLKKERIHETLSKLCTKVNSFGRNLITNVSSNS